MKQCARWFGIVMFGGLWLCFVPAKAQQSDSAIDWDRARVLNQRANRGEKLTAEDQAYLEHARAVRQNQQGQGPGAGNVPAAKDSLDLTPLTDFKAGQKYHGFEGGLYGAGRNTPPEGQMRLGMAASKKIEPLDGEGHPSPSGKIVLMSIGMSNTTQEFSRFKQIADADKEKNPQLTIVDAAQGGQAAEEWDPASRTAEEVWKVAEQRLSAARVTPQQVEVVWIKQAIKGPARLGAFPDHAKRMQENLANIVREAKRRFPNLRVAYLSSRVYAGQAKSALNPEPYAYEGGFSVRWLIEQQMGGDAALNCDPEKGKVVAPVLLWGPYLWANGTAGRGIDGLVYTKDDFGPDGTHPGNSGREKVAELLLSFLKTDVTAKGWFLAR